MQPISRRSHRLSGRALALAATLLVSGLAGCSSLNPFSRADDSVKEIVAANSGVQTTKERRFLGIFSPYRPDIQQGNFVSREMVAQVRETLQEKGGMTMEQVRFVMGTPQVQDVFHRDRWDYPFRLEKGNGDVIASHVSLHFKDGTLVRVEGGDLPTEKDYIALIAGSASQDRPETLPEQEARKPQKK